MLVSIRRGRFKSDQLIGGGPVEALAELVYGWLFKKIIIKSLNYNGFEALMLNQVFYAIARSD